MALRRSRRVIGNPGNRRVQLFLEESRAPGRDQGLAPWDTSSWADVLAGRIPGAGCLTRIDSPGEDEHVKRALVARGGGEPVEHPHGAIWGLGAAARGLQLAAEALEAAGHRLTVPADDLRVLCDKHACQRRLARSGVPVPQIVGLVHSYAELLELLHEAREPRVFVKPRHGSSATGVLAWETDGTRHQARAALEIAGTEGRPQLFNHLRVRRYSDPNTLERIVNGLCSQSGPGGLHVERWIPKAGFGGRTFDLRVLVIAGRARHRVVRTSKGPLTNLHLGNARGDIAQIQKHLGSEHWDDIGRVAEAAARCFQDSIALGVDVLAGLDGHARVAEVNAFGDLLPGVLHEGQSTYAAQLEAYAAALALA